jgi:hypothetical protein
MRSFQSEDVTPRSDVPSPWRKHFANRADHYIQDFHFGLKTVNGETLIASIAEDDSMI